MAILEARIPLQHKVYQAGERDSHGNRIGTFADPVTRYAISLYPLSASTTRSDYVSPDVVARTETDIMMDVEDPSVYKAQDEIVFVGLTFKVQGQPEFSSWDAMPIDGYADIVPGTVHIRRVT